MQMGFAALKLGLELRLGLKQYKSKASKMRRNHHHCFLGKLKHLIEVFMDVVSGHVVIKH